MSLSKAKKRNNQLEAYWAVKPSDHTPQPLLQRPIIIPIPFQGFEPLKPRSVHLKLVFWMCHDACSLPLVLARNPWFGKCHGLRWPVWLLGSKHPQLASASWKGCGKRRRLIPKGWKWNWDGGNCVFWFKLLVTLLGCDTWSVFSYYILAGAACFLFVHVVLAWSFLPSQHLCNRADITRCWAKSVQDWKGPFLQCDCPPLPWWEMFRFMSNGRWGKHESWSPKTSQWDLLWVMTTSFWMFGLIYIFDFIAVSGGLHSPVGWGNACPCPWQCGLCNVQAKRPGRGIEILYTLETSGGVQRLICEDSAAENSLDQFLCLVWTSSPHVCEWHSYPFLPQ